MTRAQTAGIHTDSPWHRQSFDKFVSESLPRLLAQRLPLTDYSVISQDTHTCRVRVSVNRVAVDYDVLQPDHNGVFDGCRVVVPTASSEKLDRAEIKSVGEQLYDYVEERLGTASHGLPWDEQLVRAWLPLDTWIREVVTSGAGETYVRWATGQWLDRTNGVAVRTHLRRIMARNIERVVDPSQFGRVCPFETPEGPNIGHILTLAIGATIRDGRIEIVDDSPKAALGLSASMVPFLEHNDPNRQLFGVNMIRQWLIPADPEPALVQTGGEPDAPDIWCGRNLLTAFVSHGIDTYEDAILVSESCANRLSYPHRANPGDKLSNRHGAKGVISRIVPDAEMPRLEDGTPVELVYSPIALHTRLNFGQIREALMGRIAYAKGEPVIVPPFGAPDDDQLREMLRKAGLPESGMEYLTLRGRKMDRPSTVGYVYWGRTVHVASDKIHAFVTGPRCNRQGELEYYTLRDLGCFETIQSHYNTCSNDRSDADAFVRAVESGLVEQAGPPSPKFAELQRRLAAMGIAAVLTDAGLRFALGAPSGDRLTLAEPVPHPWLTGHTVAEVGVVEHMLEYQAVVDANAAVGRTLESGAPESLKQRAHADLAARVAALFESLVSPDERDPSDFVFRLMSPLPPQLRFGNNVMFSGRTVLAPGRDLHLDQLGLADEIAWTIFGPLVTRELGDKEQVEKRTDAAPRVLDEIMARSWVILSRAPTLIPTAILAFHPVRMPEPVIRINPLAAFLMNADFDGDQAAVFLPITDAAQREAGERLSLAGHLRRDPNLYGLRLISNEALWGLAQLSLTAEGRTEISDLAGVPVAAPDGIVDRDSVAAALREVMRKDGIEVLMDAMQRLFERGQQVATESGASLSPFVGSSLDLPTAPETADEREWAAYADEAADLLQSRTDYSSSDLGPQLLAVKSGARGSIEHLLRLVAGPQVETDAAGLAVPCRHGMQQGLTPEELYAVVPRAREGLASIHHEVTQGAYGVRAASGPKGFGVLARAMRSSHPGRVFARAAASGETDPLRDLDSRLFVGLPPLQP